MKRTKILIVTDSPVLPTGLAETTRLIFGALVRDFPGRYEIRQLALFHCFAVTPPPGWHLYTTRTHALEDGRRAFDPEDLYGEKSFSDVVAEYRPDIVFAYNDPQHLAHLSYLSKYREYRLVLYINFDGYVPANKLFAKCIMAADRVVALSLFSATVAKTMHKASGSKVTYMYSPADTERFTPVSSPSDKIKLRRVVLPRSVRHDSFILGWVGRNLWRKHIWLAFKVVYYLRSGEYWVCKRCSRVKLKPWSPAADSTAGPFLTKSYCHGCGTNEWTPAKKLPDVVLWLHIPSDDPEAPWPLDVLEQEFNLKQGRDLIFTHGLRMKNALPPEQMPMIYQCMDCLLYLSGGEGFGNPVWEAMSCGVPIIFSDYSSHAELATLASAGEPVHGELVPEETSCAWRMIADVAEAVAAVRRLYYDSGRRKQLGENGREFVQQFTPRHQALKWHALFENLLTH